MIKKVIYIGYQPITSKYFNDYYLGTCIESGLVVEYWDISSLYFSNLNFVVTCDFEVVKKITSFCELKTSLSKIDVKSTIFIPNITYEFRVWKLYYFLTFYNCTIAFFARGAFPQQAKTDVSKIWNMFLSLDFSRLNRGIKNKLARMFKRFKIIKTIDIIFMAGSEGYLTIGSGNQFDLNEAKIISINYFDYDLLILPKDGFPIIDKHYCVFLDEYLPYHPDFKIVGINSVSPDDYYPELNIFFDHIENKFNLTVVIAAHPKALKYETENPFNGRTIVFNRTCSLVRDATFAMTHFSTSISFPVLFEKPILFLTSKAHKKSIPYLYELSLYLAQFLNCQIIHYDRFDIEQDLDCSVDIEKYANYKYRYLTSVESEIKQSSKIFIETIAQL